jgi:hypothetical protein
MTPILGKDQPALLFGVAEFLEISNAPFPFGEVDLFRLSQHKGHIIYPGTIQNLVWLVLMRTELFQEKDLAKWTLRVADENEAEVGRITFDGLLTTDQGKPQPNADIHVIPFPKDGAFVMFNFNFDATINHPGRYNVYFEHKGNSSPIGAIHFHYAKSPPLTPDQIKAIASDPNSVKLIQLVLGCKFCSTKLKVYTGFSRSPELEQDGCIWQTDLTGEFACVCGRNKYSLEYINQSMHGLLLKDFTKELTGLSYVRQYAHSQVKQIVTDFIQLLDKERLEQPVQEFIEKHPILLSRFHAKRLFVKPNILGRFNADFALVDSRNQLLLIELEKPSLKLFKKDGHPSQDLMHAYGQVTDWLHQYAQYSGAILDALGLKAAEVVSARGAVIAGRSKAVTHEVLRRHMSSPPYQNIEFMTCDDLGMSLLEISKKMA